MHPLIFATILALLLLLTAFLLIKLTPFFFTLIERLSEHEIRAAENRKALRAAKEEARRVDKARTAARLVAQRAADRADRIREESAEEILESEGFEEGYEEGIIGDFGSGYGDDVAIGEGETVPILGRRGRDD